MQMFQLKFHLTIDAPDGDDDTGVVESSMISDPITILEAMDWPYAEYALAEILWDVVPEWRDMIDRTQEGRLVWLGADDGITGEQVAARLEGAGESFIWKAVAKQEVTGLGKLIEWRPIDLIPSTEIVDMTDSADS